MEVHRLLSRVLSHNQKIALALCKTVSATLSLFASSIIIYKIYLHCTAKPNANAVNGSIRSTKTDKGMTTYYRMLLSISILDVVHSTSSAFSSLLVPSYTNGVFAHGTTATCTVQGVLQQLTPTIVIYMSMLNIYFMIKIRFNVSDAIITRKYELWLHAIPYVHFISTAGVGLWLGIFGPFILPELGCWLDSFCYFTKTCTRRMSWILYDYIDLLAWSFNYFWLFLCVFIVIFNSVLIYTAIRKQEKRNESYFAARLQKSGSVTTSTGSSKVESSSKVETEASSSSPEEHCVDDTHKSEPTISQHNDASFVASNELGSKLDDIESKPNKISGETEMTTTMSGHFPLELVNDVDCLDEEEPVSAAENKPTSRRLQNMKQVQRVKQSRVAAVQSSLYVTSALFTAVWIFLPYLGSTLRVDKRWRFFFAFMVNIVSPSQGMFNLFVFVRLHYLRLRETNTEWSRWKCVKQCLFSAD